MNSFPFFSVLLTLKLMPNHSKFSIMLNDTNIYPLPKVQSKLGDHSISSSPPTSNLSNLIAALISTGLTQVFINLGTPTPVTKLISLLTGSLA